MVCLSTFAVLLGLTAPRAVAQEGVARSPAEVRSWQGQGGPGATGGELAGSGQSGMRDPAVGADLQAAPELTVRNPFLMEDLELILWNPRPDSHLFFYLADARDVRDWKARGGRWPGLDRLRGSRVIHEMQVGGFAVPVLHQYPLDDSALLGREFCAQVVLYDTVSGEWVHSNRVFFEVHTHGLVVADAGRNSFERFPAVRIYEPRGENWVLENELSVGGIPSHVVFSGDLSRAFILTSARDGIIEVIDCQTGEGRELPPLGPGVVGMEVTLDGTRLVALARQTNDRNSFAPPGVLYVIDALSGELIRQCAVAPVSAGASRAFAIDERRGVVWVGVDGLYVQPVNLLHGTCGPMQGVAAREDQAIVDIQIVDDTLLVLCRGREGNDTGTLHCIELGTLDYQSVRLPGEAVSMHEGPSVGAQRGHSVCLLSRPGDRVWVVEVATRKISTTLSVAAGATELAVAPAHGEIVLLYPGTPSRRREVGRLRVVDLATGRLRGEVDLGLSHQEGLVVVTLPDRELVAFLIPATGRCHLVDLDSLAAGPLSSVEDPLVVGLRPRALIAR